MKLGRELAENSLSYKNFSQGAKIFDRLKYQPQASNVIQSKGAPISGQTEDVTPTQYEFNVFDATALHTAGAEDFLFKTITEWGTKTYKVSPDVLKMDIWPLLGWCHPYRKGIIRVAKT